jgi:hypothetical protein
MASAEVVDQGAEYTTACLAVQVPFLRRIVLLLLVADRYQCVSNYILDKGACIWASPLKCILIQQ